MSSDVAIRAENLGKMYRIGGPQARYSTFRETVVDAVAAPFRRVRRLLAGHGSAAELDKTIWALKGVSFEVKRGEVLGIIGRNGAGKSTLLKVLSRITEPTEGWADIHGRVGSLLEVGTGFHPELTGRENIYLSGSILGMRRAEIDRNLDQIVEFAEISKFIDTPVKHYSSGMYVRLAFAVAAHLEPEILLVDEVLAVGDAAFQKKCLGKMGEVAQQGRTVLFVSHNMAAMANLCERGMVLDHGRVEQDTDIGHAVSCYFDSLTERRQTRFERLGRYGDTGQARFADLKVTGDDGTESGPVTAGGRVSFHLSYESRNVEPVKNAIAEVKLTTVFGQVLLTSSTFLMGIDLGDLPPKGQLCCEIPSLPLTPGTYVIRLVLQGTGVVFDHVDDAGHLTVVPSDYYASGRLPRPQTHGPFLFASSWHLEPTNI